MFLGCPALWGSVKYSHWPTANITKLSPAASQDGFLHKFHSSSLEVFDGDLKDAKKACSEKSQAFSSLQRLFSSTEPHNWTQRRLLLKIEILVRMLTIVDLHTYLSMVMTWLVLLIREFIFRSQLSSDDILFPRYRSSLIDIKLLLLVSIVLTFVTCKF